MSHLSLDAYSAHFSAEPGYLDFARFGPPSHDVNTVSSKCLSSVSRGFAPIDDLQEVHKRVRAQIASLTGRPSEDAVTFASSTSVANTMVAMALPADPRSEIVLSPREFPANVYPWIRANAFGGPAVRWLETDNGLVTPESVARQLTPATVGVVVSAVDFRTGYRADLAALREVVGDRLLLVDAIQGFGAVDAPWHLADALMVGGQKWLRAGWGTGFISLSDRAVERLGDGLAGWLAVESPFDYDGTVHPTRRDGQRMMITTPDLVAVARLSSALDLLSDLGIAEMNSAITERTTYVRSVVSRAGGVLLSNVAVESYSGITSFHLPGASPQQLHERLKTDGILVTCHDSYVRLSVHATTPISILDEVGRSMKGLAL
ncbi:MAG: aminotransferase class V-fold PLP-dependent enzyme [Acidobacteria bacterium]|nr:aminotransferase class V-fold PLP-dependent enzyme [Acidobacteriota bacterium]